MKNAYLGVDVGSVSTNLVVMDENGEILQNLYIRTMGQPVKAVQEGLKELGSLIGDDVQIKAGDNRKCPYSYLRFNRC